MRRATIIILQVSLLIALVGAEWTAGPSGMTYYYLRAFLRIIPLVVLAVLGVALGVFRLRLDNRRLWLTLLGVTMFAVPLLTQFQVVDEYSVRDLRDLLLNGCLMLLCGAFGYWIARDPRDVQWMLRRFAVVLAGMSTYAGIVRFSGIFGEGTAWVPAWAIRLLCLFAYCWYLHSWLTATEKRGLAFLGLAASCPEVVLSFHKPVIFSVLVSTAVLVIYCFLSSESRWRVVRRGLILACMGVVAFLFADVVSRRAISGAMNEQIEGRFLHQAYGPAPQTLYEIIEQASSGRLFLWEGGLELFFQHPWFGSGQLAYVERFGEARSLHNTYLDLLVSVGLVGAIPVFAFILLWLRSVFRPSVVRNRWHLIAPCVAYCMGILAYSCIGTSRLFYAMNGFLVLLMTLTAGIAAQLAHARANARIQRAYPSVLYGTPNRLRPPLA
jgi:O-antigen ligase